MGRLPMLALAAFIAAEAALPAKAVAGGLEDCARAAQDAVAKRHRLRVTESGALSSKIYGDPKLAQEADDAFDACVRRRPSP
jgi:hypothetical protein